MIQVLTRACEILKILAESETLPLGSGQIAKRAKLNPATCARILQALTEQGLVLQLGHKKGYLLGPLLHRLSALGGQRQDLVWRVEPILRELAEKVEECVTLSSWWRDRRFIIAEVAVEREVNLRRYHREEDENVYRLASGRLFLAHLPEAQLEQFLHQHGLPPADIWPAAADAADFRRELAAIRAAELCITREAQIGAAALAVPVCRDTDAFIALGVHMPNFRYPQAQQEQAMIASLRPAASRIAEIFAT